MKHIFVINPAAGKHDSSKSLIEKIKFTIPPDILYDIYVTKAPGEIQGFIQDKSALEEREGLRFYICGGDGSLNEAVSAVVDNRNIELGCIPIGSGNDFVKNFPDCSFFEIMPQIKAQSKKIDLIKVQDRRCMQDKHCINIASIGFDANVAYNMKKFKRIPLISGNAAYSISVVYSLLSRINTAMQFSIDGSAPEHGNLLITTIANGFCYGGHYKAAPYAKIDDGMIDFCYISATSRLKILKLIKIFEKGEHPEKLSNLVRYKKCKSVKIYHKKLLKVNLDGEIYLLDSPTFQILPQALNFILPY